MLQPDSNRCLLDSACCWTDGEENSTDLLEIYNHWHEFAKDWLFGIEINDQIANVCKMNRMMGLSISLARIA